MKKVSVISALILLLLPLGLSAQDVDTSKIKASYYEVNPFVDDNEACLKCHGELKYTITDTTYGRTITQQLCPDKHIERDDYYSAVHKSFSCTDCHSYEYTEFPHSLESRLEEYLLCMDCHGYDETYAHYHFEDIEVEFAESIHNMNEFTCWKCHDPHSYRAFMRTAEDLSEAVLYDNNMCLECHADFGQFQLLTNRSEINIIEQHDWLPNQTAHFANVRCIECHTEINDSILIAHKILPSEQAVKNCEDCHSQDSRLLHTLYKFQSGKEWEIGLINGVILKNSFVIGANQNRMLNWLSFIILGITLAGIAVHSIMRIKN